MKKIRKIRILDLCTDGSDSWRRTAEMPLIMATEAAETQPVGCVAQLAERRSLAGDLTLSYARPAADG